MTKVSCHSPSVVHHPQTERRNIVKAGNGKGSVKDVNHDMIEDGLLASKADRRHRSMNCSLLASAAS